MNFVNSLIANCALVSAVLIATPVTAQGPDSPATTPSGEQAAPASSRDVQYQALEQQYLKQLQQSERAQQEYQNQKDAYEDATRAKSAAQERITVNATNSYKPFDIKQCPDGDDNNCRLATCVSYATPNGIINICQSHGNGFP